MIRLCRQFLCKPAANLSHCGYQKQKSYYNNDLTANCPILALCRSAGFVAPIDKNVDRDHARPRPSQKKSCSNRKIA